MPTKERQAIYQVYQAKKSVVQAQIWLFDSLVLPRHIVLPRHMVLPLISLAKEGGMANTVGKGVVVERIGT